MQIQISWLLKKPTDLDLHCLQRQSISGLSRTRVKDSIFLISSRKIHFETSSELPQLGSSDENSKRIYGEIRKKNQTVYLQNNISLEPGNVIPLESAEDDKTWLKGINPYKLMALADL